MTIQDIKEQLHTATHPVARALHKNEHFKVLIIGFNEGMILKNHKAHLPTKLTVLEGSVIYKEADKVITLQQYEEIEIPLEITHSVEAVMGSLCLLTQGQMDKHDIVSEKDIKKLVDAFYAKVMVDPVIGYIFTDVAKISLEHHMPVMYSFWSSMLLGTDTYRDNPMVKHMNLDKQTNLVPEHFVRWLHLWEETVNELFSGENAVEAIKRAKSIGAVMEYKVKQVR